MSAPRTDTGAAVLDDAALRPTRNEVWALLGAPTDQIGSVNDPRTHDDYGVRWNEQWIYRDGREIVRVVLWNRYDFLGVFRVAPDGSVMAEPLPD
jgi:hypothetical protein